MSNVEAELAFLFNVVAPMPTPEFNKCCIEATSAHHFETLPALEHGGVCISATLSCFRHTQLFSNRYREACALFNISTIHLVLKARARARTYFLLRARAPSSFRAPPPNPQPTHPLCCKDEPPVTCAASLLQLSLQVLAGPTSHYVETLGSALPLLLAIKAAKQILFRKCCTVCLLPPASTLATLQSPLATFSDARESRHRLNTLLSP